MGTGVFGGMLLATFIATIFIPLFFSWLSSSRARKTADIVEDEQPGEVHEL
jgi:multidrug efflux pump